jgi:1-acyl-sn-glycerol-3-phosphate acyltransferase
MRAMAIHVLWILRVVGGVKIDDRARIPGVEGVLVISNHQSLLDIPIVVRAIVDSHPRIVTRRRYARRIPLISLLLRLSRSPFVDSKTPLEAQLASLAEVARTTEQPIVIFPEGHRSKDGRVRPFKRAGLGAILAARPWSVYLVAVDGLWRAGKFVHLASSLSNLRGRVVSSGPIAWPGPGADAGAFIDEMERRLTADLERMRSEGA